MGISISRQSSSWRCWGSNGDLVSNIKPQSSHMGFSLHSVPSVSVLNNCPQHVSKWRCKKGYEEASLIGPLSDEVSCVTTKYPTEPLTHTVADTALKAITTMKTQFMEEQTRTQTLTRNPFDGSDLKKLQGYLLECKLDVQYA